MSSSSESIDESRERTVCGGEEETFDEVNEWTEGKERRFSMPSKILANIRGDDGEEA